MLVPGGQLGGYVHLGVALALDIDKGIFMLQGLRGVTID